VCGCGGGRIEFEWRRQIFDLAFGRAAIGPAHDALELFGCERLVVPEIAEAFHGSPGRHATGQHFLLDGFRPWPAFGVTRQRERASAGVMAGCATLVHDSDDLAIPGDGGRDDVVALRRRWREQQHRKDERAGQLHKSQSDSIYRTLRHGTRTHP